MNKCRVVFFLAIIFLSACSQNQRKPELFIQKPNINLNEIKFDSTYNIRYSLVNKGNGVLLIDTATASCGCTIPGIMKRTVEPLDSAILVVQYKPVDTGFFDKKIVIKSNIDSTFSVVSFKGRAIK